MNAQEIDQYEAKCKEVDDLQDKVTAMECERDDAIAELVLAKSHFNGLANGLGADMPQSVRLLRRRANRIETFLAGVSK